ncbi:MAG: cytochrome c biogenesis protein CcdA [Ginsengibacter sp.]
MTRYSRVLICALMLLFAGNLFSQDSSVNFSFTKERLNDKQVLLKINAAISPGIELFGIQKSPDDPLYSNIHFDSTASHLLIDSIISNGKEHNEYDSLVEARVHYFTDSVSWVQKLNAGIADSFLLKGTVTYMYKKGDQYLPAEKEFKFFIQPETTESATISPRRGDITTYSLWWIFAAAFAGGLIALITPCVYSMIPVTVSFFTKRSTTKAEGIRNAVYYSSSIVVIFTLIGFLVTVIFGPTALNNIATNWIANLVFFTLFLVFGISFLGAFNIELPSSWGNKADSKAGTKNFMGIFFMALTLVIISFSCTGPIIGPLLVVAARGSYYGPLIGMFGFSLALALPFALFAFFPGMLNVLGKAGGWLNSVKVTLGFLELALALKFLSNADLAKGWRLLDREIFITLWIVIFMLLGIYLLGKIKFHHDDELPKNDFDLPYITIPRLFFAMASFAFAVYMIPGLWGAPLKGISAFVPPMGTQDFTTAAADRDQIKDTSHISNVPHPLKYYDQMRIYEPDVVTKYGMVIYYDYDEALEVARKVHKPLMLDFTGINCVNCRKMEGQVWSDPAVMKRLKENFIIVSLYIDVHNIYLQKNEQYFSKSLSENIETLGDKNVDLQVSKYNANTQPFYFFLDGNENRLAPDGYGYDPSIKKFIQRLDDVTAAYSKSQ